MAQLIYKAGQRKHLFAVRQLLPDPKDDDCYIAGDLVAVYSSTDATDVSQQARDKGLVVPPYVVVHVTGYMLALTHQGQGGFRVWVVESDEVTHEQYIMSLVDMVRASWTVRKTL
ncbi:MAG: hypothetical protein ACJ8AP_14860 [Gemmatimonadales bacterium]